MAQYNLSYQANSACKEAIEQTISAHYAENRLDTEAAVKDVLEKFGTERVQFILANTIQRKNYDGRISQDNKAWAKTIPTLEDSGASRHCAYLVVDQVNPGLTDLFTRQFRKVAQEQQKSSVLQKLKQEPPARKPATPKNGSRSDNHGKAQAGCAGFVLGVRRRTGTDPSKDAAIRDREFERLSAENGAGWLCGQAGTARAEGAGLLMRRSSNNLNQLTRKVHETGRVYNADLEDISQRQEQLWEGVKEILTQLSKLS